jgi:hypothetical protein
MRIPIIVVSRVKKACGSFRNSESTSSDSESQPLFPSDIQIQNRENPYCCLFLIFLLLMFIVGSVVGAGIFFLNSDGKNKSLMFNIFYSSFIAKYTCVLVQRACHTYYFTWF